jgi:hypothetical protein
MGTARHTGLRHLLAELERLHPRWRDLARAFAGQPEFPALGEILSE